MAGLRPTPAEQDTARADPGHDDAVADAMKEFDPRFYMLHNADLREAGVDPVTHFREHGLAEGRDPNPLFWSGFYRDSNPDVVESGEAPFVHYVRHGRDQGRPPNPVGLKLWPAMQAPEAAEWQGAARRADLASDVVVIVPVYKGYGETLRTLYELLTQPQATPFGVLVVNDATPDARLGATLDELAANGHFHLIVNDSNLGFVGSVNRALAACSTDVVLLNADAQVHGDWLDRMRVHAYSGKVATVTPFSNNASICSYPDPNTNNVIALEADPATLDGLAAMANRGLAIDIPTGVGFCMYVRRDALDEVGVLDEHLFGKGYGEECDLCFRAMKAGWRNLLAQDVFVFHAGQVSFGVENQDEYDQGQVALSTKHPDYLGVVTQFIKADLGLLGRRRLDAARVAHAVRGRAGVMITHAKGGGIEQHVDRLADDLAEEGTPTVVIEIRSRDGGTVDVVTGGDLRLYLPSLRGVPLGRNLDLIRELLGWMEPAFIHVHSFAGAGWRDTVALMEIVRSAAAPFVVTLHDYASVCHRNNLVLASGSFCGLPPLDACRTCLATDKEAGEEPDPAVRREVYGRFLGEAASVIAPSRDTAGALERVYGRVAIAVKPHAEKDVRVRRARSADDRPGRKVAVVGAIGAHKGALVLHALAKDARQRSLPLSFTVVGYSSIPEQLRDVGVEQTGAFRDDERALDLLDELSPDLILLPSVWPETYMYALSIALRSGAPPVVFDIGAQAERLRALQTGLILPYGLISDPQGLNDALMDVDLTNLRERVAGMPPVTYRDTLRSYLLDRSVGPPRR